MPTWMDLRRTPVSLADEEVEDHLADPMALRARERELELEGLGSGRGLATQTRSSDPVRADLRHMAEDPVFGKGESTWSGLTRPEEAADARRKAERQAEWDGRKGELGGVSRVGRGLHKIDKLTGHMGADLAHRYGGKGLRGYKERAGVGGLELPGYAGKGHGGFFDKRDFASGVKSKSEVAGRRMLGAGISGVAKLSGEAPLVGPVLGAVRDGALANYESNRATRAGMIASRPGTDEVTASLARGSQRRHEQRRDESGLKATVRGGLAATMIPGLASLGASAAASLKGGLDFARSDARKTRLKAAGGDDDALVKLGEDDQDFRRAMMEYLAVGEEVSGSDRARRGLATAKGAEADWGDSRRPGERERLGMSGAPLGSGGPSKAVALSLLDDEDDDFDPADLELSEDESMDRIDVMDPAPFDAEGLAKERAQQAELDLAMGEYSRVREVDGPAESEHLLRHGALLDDMGASFDPVAARQTRILPELDDGQEHTLRPSLVAKRSHGESARKRQRDRTDRTLLELMELDESAWYDSRRRG